MEILKRKTFWYALIALLVFCTDIWVYFYLKDTSRLSARSLSKQILPAPRETNFAHAEQPLSVIHTSNSDRIEIKSMASHLSSSDIQSLAQDAINPQKEQDIRFKSVYLLAQNKHIPEILKEIVTTPIPENLNARERDFEHVVRAQAIEGIENSEEKTFSKQILTELMQKTDNVFLLDRLNRAKNSLDGVDGSSEVQDNRELEKIIEN